MLLIGSKDLCKWIRILEKIKSCENYYEYHCVNFIVFGEWSLSKKIFKRVWWTCLKCSSQIKIWL
jgi:hypothetical protein